MFPLFTDPLVEELEALGDKVTYTEYPGVSHAEIPAGGRRGAELHGAAPAARGDRPARGSDGLGIEGGLGRLELLVEAATAPSPPRGARVARRSAPGSTRRRGRRARPRPRAAPTRRARSAPRARRPGAARSWRARRAIAAARRRSGPRLAAPGDAAASGSSRARWYSAQPLRWLRSSPSSQTSVRLPTASSRARSWETRTTAPSNSRRASSSASRLSMSRWLVGSSRIRTLAPEATRIASERRRCSPPEMSLSFFSDVRAREEEAAEQVAGLLAGQPGLALHRLEHGAVPGGALGVLGEVADARRGGPAPTLPAAGSRIPARVSISVVLPAPLGPTTTTCSPRSTSRLASSSSVRPGTSIRAPSIFSTIRPARSGCREGEAHDALVARVARRPRPA